MMRKSLGTTVVVLLFKIYSRRLLFVGAILTVVSALFQIYTLSYPLTGWWFHPLVEVSPTKNLNLERHLEENINIHLGKIDHLEVIQHFQSVVPQNYSADQVPLKKSSTIAKKTARVRKRTREPPSAPLLPGRNVSNHLLRYIESLSPDEGLAYAKKEIEKAPFVVDDPDLYVPLFRNVSIFKRSYELMELILRVYIYQEGKRPIFHVPYLRGIYSSEGWFMKHMEENRQFVTKDPKKAHLFYIPYSAKQLQRALYVRNSHNLRPLSLFLRDHVNMLAAKYPFWNHTRGSDHFLVACHDWGPYTLTDHEELLKNTIKALCNADLSEGIFVAGKDVSLPETTIRNPKRPLRNVGGKRVSQRPILAFFAGRTHGRVRPRLIKYWSDKDEDMRIYAALPNRVSKIMNYAEHMKSSKYCICPMGFEVNSPRVVEAIYYECVPVIIADNFSLPFNEVLNWSAFSVRVAEKDIPKLKEILLAIPVRQYLTMQTNIKKLQKHFLWNSRPTRFDLFHMILHSLWFSRLNQFQIPEQS
ncbi:PREDICTED: probable glycosyltransferase At5g03795 [Ipomoea nil]|uniref:probable glycosyltransferase At5g03795 n=1 Tax=Ipomoea nil TaxID=35883 RepID=UPI000901C0DA|nr:PREDICTED: probable glycosyltransferase At5g03795 [Ipomoea nil]